MPYEYKFIRVEQGIKEESYRKVIQQQAEEGWRLVQVLAPGAGGAWAAPNFVEVILERDRG